MARSNSSATDIIAASRHVQSEDAALDVTAPSSPQSRSRLIARPSPTPTVQVGRYQFAECIARGGMATVHFARLHGDFDFSRIVAVKRLLPQFATDEQFKAMFIEEARLAARIRHPNVVPTLDVVADGSEVILVMDYVDGESLSSLTRYLRHQPDVIVPLGVTAAIVSDVLRGLAFAHATTARDGTPLNIVHCDVSPQNILVGVDGVSRVLDFGIAKATNSLSEPTEEVVRGKPGYIAPEQFKGAPATPQTDLFAVGVVLWEMLAGRRLFGGGFKASLARRNLGPMQPPSVFNPLVIPQLDAVVLKALAREPLERYRDATEMMHALEAACPPVRPSTVAEWIEQLAAHTLAERRHLLARLESESKRPPTLQSEGTSTWAETTEVRTDTISTARSLQTSVVKGPATHQRHVQRLTISLAVLLVAFVAGGVLMQGKPNGAEGQASHSSSAPTEVSTPQIVVAREQVARAVTPTPSTTPTAASTRTPLVPVEQANLSRAVTPTTPIKSPPNSGSPRTTGPRNNSCSPPYTIDGAGRKHYRAECFR